MTYSVGWEQKQRRERTQKLSTFEIRIMNPGSDSHHNSYPLSEQSQKRSFFMIPKGTSRIWISGVGLFTGDQCNRHRHNRIIKGCEWTISLQ